MSSRNIFKDANFINKFCFRIVNYFRESARAFEAALKKEREYEFNRGQEIALTNRAKWINNGYGHWYLSEANNSDIKIFIVVLLEHFGLVSIIIAKDGVVKFIEIISGLTALIKAGGGISIYHLKNTYQAESDSKDRRCHSQTHKNRYNTSYKNGDKQ